MGQTDKIVRVYTLIFLFNFSGFRAAILQLEKVNLVNL